MATMTRGTAGRSNTLAASWERDVEDDVKNLVGEEGKLTKFADMAGSVPAKSFVHEWPTSEHRPMFTTISATPSNATTNLTMSVTDDDIFDVNDVWLHEDGETGIIDSVVHGASPTITLKARSRGATAAISLAQNDIIYNMGKAQDDGDEVGTAYITQDVIWENPVQIFAERVEFDGTTLAVNAAGGIYGGDFEARKRGEVMKALLQRMDMAFIYGEAAETAGVGSDTHRTMGGIREFIPSTETDTIATLSQTNLENFMATKGFLHGPEEKVVICSYTGATGLNSYATSRVDYAPGGKKIGFEAKEFVTPVGKMVVIPHYNLQIAGSAAQKGLFLFCPKGEFRKAVLRPMKLYGDVNLGLRDIKTDVWLGQHTINWGNPRHYAEINGVTAYA